MTQAELDTGTAKGRTVTRGWVITLVAIVGALVTYVPFALSDRVDEKFGMWQVLLAATLTNIGTTILLAAVLFLLERTFTRHVTAAVADTTRREVAAQTQDLRAETGSLRIKVADLQRELDERRQTQVGERQATVDAVREVGSFDSVADLLEEANSLRALRHGDVTVPAGSGLDAPRVTVYWGERDRGQPRFSVDRLFAEDQTSAIELAYDVPADVKRGGWSPAEVYWRPGMSSADALEALMAAMQASGYGAAAAQLGPSLFTNLADAVGAAMAARTAPAGAWVTGPLMEWVADGWAITEAGLEGRDSAGIAAADFPEKVPLRRTPGQRSRNEFAPPVPPGVDPDLWRFAVKRAEPHFGTSTSSPVQAALDAAMRLAYTTETSPRRRAR